MDVHRLKCWLCELIWLIFIVSGLSLSLLDISKVGVWKEAQKLSDPELALRVPQLLDLVLVSNVPSTTTTYS